MYKTKYYKLSELVHPQIINAIGEVNAWLRLDEDVLKDIDSIREEWYCIYGSGIYVNRLNLTPPIDSRGLRPPNDPDGSFYSTHKHGNTFDLEPINGKIEELYTFIKGMMKAGRLRKINTLENFKDTVKWVHAGYMNTEKIPLIINLKSNATKQ